MSTTIVAVIVNLLATFLPYIGITVASQNLETTIQTLTALVTGVWIWYQRTTLKKDIDGVGDVTKFGVRR